jgi:ribonucleoside-diphosphate reductase alpha chain
MSQRTITKRNGTEVPLDPSRITKAILGAMREKREAQNEVLKECDREAAAAVTELVLQRMESRNLTNVEEIQDEVETCLFKLDDKPEFANCELRLVAKRYINYRTKRAESREAIESLRKLTVTKSDGTRVPFDPKPLYDAIYAACHGIADVSAQAVFAAAEQKLYDGVKTHELTDAMSQAAIEYIEAEPNYRYVAARLLLQKNGEEAFRVQGQSFKAGALPIDYKAIFPGIIKKATEIVAHPDLLTFDLEALAAAIVPERDYLLKYMGMQTLYDRYFIVTPKTKERVELPQAFFMRVAMGLARTEKPEEKTRRAIEFYNVLSTLTAMSSTPTLFNSGLKHSQMSSCFLSTTADDLYGIFQGYQDDSAMSKWAGGIGQDFTPVRGSGAWIKGTNGNSLGLVPWLKILNDTALAVNQGSKRKGAICAYLECWHIDVLDYIELRNNTGDDRRRTHDLNLANWIPDLFMQRVMQKGHWTLFSPDITPDLHDLTGQAFKQRYEEYEALFEKGPTVTQSSKLANAQEIVATTKNSMYPARRVPAQALYRQMLTNLAKSGYPWMTFKDPCNIRYSQKHEGVVHNSNLCVEITLHNRPTQRHVTFQWDPAAKTTVEKTEVTQMGEVAVCNLASLVLTEHLTENNQIDAPKLKATIKTVMRMLDNVIDLNYYPIPETQNANQRNRPVGLGIMGWHDMLYRMGIAYDSPEAVEAADAILELISYLTFEASHQLALERGPYPTFNGSTWSQGILPLDTMKTLREQRGSEYCKFDDSFTLEWDILREKVKKGMRNSLCLAIAPTATIGNIVGVSNAIDPHNKIFYSRGNLSGDFSMFFDPCIEDLKKLGLWNAEIIQKIKINNGTIQTIDEIPEEIRRRAKTAFEIEPLWLIQSGARRQKWIDQAQSLNLYVSETNSTGKMGTFLQELYLEAWMAGLKTTYYLRTPNASEAEKTGVEVQKLGLNSLGVKINRASQTAPTNPPLNQDNQIPGFTTEKQLVCSLDAQRNGTECEACQ